MESSREAARPVTTFPQSITRLHGAHFSPLTGKYVSTLSDDMLSIFDMEDCVSGDGEAKCELSLLDPSNI